MARVPRIHIENGLYYITSSGDHNQDIFTDVADYQIYLELLKKYKQQYGFRLFAYCLLPSHLHLLLELKENLKISDIMHDLNSNYTKYFNPRHQRKGHLFQERYKMSLIEKEGYILGVIYYIHMNPVKLGMVNQPGEYQWSSYIYYEGKKTQPVRIDMQEERQEVEAIGSALKPQYTTELAKDLAKKAIIGSEAFVKKVQAKVKASSTKSQTPKAAAQELAPEHRKFVLAGTLAIAALGCLALFLFVRSVEFKKYFKNELAKKDTELTERITQEKKRITQDLKEKYAADMVSYEAMSRRLEMEKNKTKELQDKLIEGKGGER